MQKKLFFISALLCIAGFTSKAQIFVGGSLDLSIMSNDTYNQSNIGISPVVGYRLSEKMAAGGSISLNRSKTNYDNGNESLYRTFDIGGFLRYYLAGNDSKVKFYAQGAANLEFGKSIDIADNETTTTGFGLNVRPGIEAAITEKLKLDVKFGSAGLWLDFDGGGNQVYLRMNQLTFGFIYELSTGK